MMNAVRPWSRRRSACSIRRSVPMSTELVASSRIRMRGSASSARAKATSWRCPSERRKPRSPSCGVVAVLEPLDELVGADRPRGGDDLLAGRARAAEGDVVGDRAGEEEALLRHDPELPPQRLLRDVAEVDAVDRDAALGRVVEAGDQLRDRRLAGAGVADERDGRPGRDVEVDAVQHLGAGAVGEVDVVEADVAADLGRARSRRRLVGHLRLLVEHLHDLVERRDRREEGAVELRELLHRVEEVRQRSRGTRSGRRSSSARRRRGSRRSRGRSPSRATRAGRRTGSRRAFWHDRLAGCAAR